MNTHYYDGKWMERYTKLKELNLPLVELSSTKYVSLFMQPIHHSFINLVMNSGVDPANGVSGKELLLMLFGVLDNKHDDAAYTQQEWHQIINLSLEQIADIANGSCLQGQASRIFQILAAIVGI